MNTTFGKLKKGDRFLYQEREIIKTMRIKDGNDGAFYTAVDINTGCHYKILDDEVVQIDNKSKVYRLKIKIETNREDEYIGSQIVEGKSRKECEAKAQILADSYCGTWQGWWLD